MIRHGVFVAYASFPPEIGFTIEDSAKILRASPYKIPIRVWRQSDIAGRFIADGIMKKIDSADYIVADITRLNFNVTFEVGYAIGREKRVIVIINNCLKPPKQEIEQLGIYVHWGIKYMRTLSNLFIFFLT